MTNARRHLPVVQSDETYERNYAVRKAMADENARRLAAAIELTGDGADEYGMHVVHDKLGLEPEQTFYCRRDNGVWSPPAPEREDRVFARVANFVTPSGVRYSCEAVTIPEGRFADAAVTRFHRRYDISTVVLVNDYRPRTPDQMKAAAEQRRAKELAKREAEERAEAERRSWQLELPIGGSE